MDWALWLKALHIMAFAAWMAGMWYLPRLMVYHAGAAVGSESSETFKIMERRLLQAITTPAMLVTLAVGLALATLVRRQGRAVALTVTLYLVPTAAWFFLLWTLANNQTGALLAVGSPFYGPIFGLFCSIPDQMSFEGAGGIALMTWWFAYMAVATLLQASTLMGFDRRLGRMPEGTNARPAGPPRPAAPRRGNRERVR